MAKASMSTLCPELVDQILDFLYDDHLSLEACSLVCKAWVPATSFHLFSYLALDPNCAYRLPVSRVLHPLHTIFQSWPRIANSVRHLEFTGKTLHLHSPVEMTDIFEASWEIVHAPRDDYVVALDVLADMVVTFPNIRSLHILPSSLVKTATEVLNHWTPALTKPTNVALESLTLGLPRGTIQCTYLTEMLSMFSSIEHMKITSIASPLTDLSEEFNLESQSDDVPPTKLRVRNLDYSLVGSQFPPALLAVMPRLADLSYLETLTIPAYPIFPRGGDSQVNEVLSQMTNLKTLHLSLRHIVPDANDDTFIQSDPPQLLLNGLSGLMSLRSINISVRMWIVNHTAPHNSAAHNKHLFRICIQQLALLPPCLQHVCLCIQHDAPPKPMLPLLQALPWQDFSDVVEKQRELQSLKIELPATPQTDEKKFIRARLSPQLRQVTRIRRRRVPLLSCYHLLHNIRIEPNHRDFA